MEERCESTCSQDNGERSAMRLWKVDKDGSGVGKARRLGRICPESSAQTTMEAESELAMDQTELTDQRCFW